MSWTQLPGAASDIGIGPKGLIMVTGYPNKVDGDNYALFRWSNRKWNIVPNISGVRISIGPNGNAWVCKADGSIYSHNRSTSTWTQIAGGASDVGVGADGSVYVIGYPNKVDGDNYAVFKWLGNTWEIVPNISGVRIAVDPQGNPWVLKANGNIYAFNGSGWTQIAGGASDVGIGADGSVYVTGYPNKVDGNNYAVFKWDGSSWDIVGGVSGINIAVGPKGFPFVLNANGGIFTNANIRIA